MYISAPLCSCIHVYMYLCMHVFVHGCECVCCAYVTGFLKTDRIVTLGLLHFIGPANGYTCTLHIHNAILSLVDWSVFL